jgi:hypothetical protein
LEQQPVNPPRADPPVRRTPADPLTTPAPTLNADDSADGLSRWETLALTLLALLLASAVLPAVKVGRRIRRRHRGDDRERVVGALCELESALTDLGLAPSAALTASERGEALRTSVGLDAGELYRRAAEARFARRPPPPDAVRWCWQESSRLRRAARRAAGPRARWASAFRTRSLRRATLFDQ